jgi:toxin ParE1/3/4
MRVIRHPEVAQELEAAALWYEERSVGLGVAFLDEYELRLREVLEDPKRSRRFFRDNRKLSFHRFPYAIVYSIEEDGIYIKAVMHLHRRPLYWKKR